MDEPTDDDLTRYRTENFAVNVTDSHTTPGEIALNWTFNGFQWTTASFTPEEARRVVEALLKKLAGVQP